MKNIIKIFLAIWVCVIALMALVGTLFGNTLVGAGIGFLIPLIFALGALGMFLFFSKEFSRIWGRR